ncbi:MAG: hypothetical protein MZV70_74795 [Desulfobacterales bacterium]|nr:hypothetical protein [Desulfobacterales bacterium]
MIVLHVIDQRFVQECVRRKLAEPRSRSRNNLFIDAKTQLQALLAGGRARRRSCQGGRLRRLSSPGNCASGGKVQRRYGGHGQLRDGGRHGGHIFRRHRRKGPEIHLAAGVVRAAAIGRERKE